MGNLDSVGQNKLQLFSPDDEIPEATAPYETAISWISSPLNAHFAPKLSAPSTLKQTLTNVTHPHPTLGLLFVLYAISSSRSIELIILILLLMSIFRAVVPSFPRNRKHFGILVGLGHARLKVWCRLFVMRAKLLSVLNIAWRRIINVGGGEHREVVALLLEPPVRLPYCGHLKIKGLLLAVSVVI